MRVNEPASAEFTEALEDARKNRTAPQPLCKGRPEAYMDYDEIPPSEAECKALCAPCPLLAICKRSAVKNQRPAHGVQGGIAWQDGKQYHWLEKLGHLAGDSDSTTPADESEN